MKSKLRFVLILLAGLTAIYDVAAQGTAFTYQGQLQQSGGPASGKFDFTFNVYTNNAGGVAIASPVTNLAVGVTNGLFTTIIDFGPNVFLGASNWLELAVRTNTGGNGAFTTLAPRQQLTPTPYALFAATANSISSTNLLLPGVLTLFPPINRGEVAAIYAGNSPLALFDGMLDFYAGGAGSSTGTIGLNVGIGYGAMSSVIGGNGNVGIGYSAMNADTDGTANVALGYEALFKNTIGNGNTAIGELSLFHLQSGNNNVALGSVAGYNLDGSESNDIYLGSLGVAGESGTIRIGNPSFQTNTVIAGAAQVFFTDGNSVQFTDEGFTPGMVITNNNANNGHLRFRNYFEVWPNLAGTLPGGLDVRDTNGNPTILMNGSTGVITASNFVSGPNGTFNGGANNVVSGSDSSVNGGTLNTNTGSDAVIGGGNLNTINDNSTFIGGGSQNTIFAGGLSSAIAGGGGNSISTQGTFVGGGFNNSTVAGADFSVLSGGANNKMQAGAKFGVISGGSANINNGFIGIIAGGQNNLVNGSDAAISGGGLNTNNGNFATIGGGVSNIITSSGVVAFIGNGLANTNSGSLATIGGGGFNQAVTNFATVPGGSNNLASGQLSLAAGADADAINQGAFVWADSQGVPFSSQANDSFNVRAQGGVRLFVSSTNSGDGNTVQFIDEGGVVPGMVISNNNGNSGHLRFRNYLEIQPNLANTVAGGLDVRNASGIATITLNGANGAVGATTFSGSGSGLTSLPAANLTGSLPSISGANLMSLNAASLTGALPAISGANLLNLNATNLMGALPAISGTNLTAVPSNVALLNAGDTFTEPVSGGATLTVTGNRNGGFGSGIMVVENTSPSDASPALRVASLSTENTPAGALSVSISSAATVASDIIAEFGNSSAFVLTITNDGSVYSASNLVAAGNVFANGMKLTSDRNAKENFAPLDVRSVLDKVTALPLSEWNYKTETPDNRHIGPMAQDFHGAFGLDGSDDKHISMVDESGVALAAIQGLNQKLEQEVKTKDEEIDSLKLRMKELETVVNRLAATAAPANPSH